MHRIAVGETAVFAGIKIRACESEHKGRRRCDECCFQDMWEMCYFLGCSRTGSSRQNYQIYDIWREKEKAKKKAAKAAKYNL